MFALKEKSLYFLYIMCISSSSFCFWTMILRKTWKWYIPWNIYSSNYSAVDLLQMYTQIFKSNYEHMTKHEKEKSKSVLFCINPINFLWAKSCEVWTLVGNATMKFSEFFALFLIVADTFFYKTDFTFVLLLSNLSSRSKTWKIFDY